MPEGPAPAVHAVIFPAFYEAINERPPFPWQARLAKHVAETDSWPIEVGVPTGLGKTACLDIAIWWLASQADLSPADRTARDQDLVAGEPASAGRFNRRARAID